MDIPMLLFIILGLFVFVVWICFVLFLLFIRYNGDLIIFWFKILSFGIFLF